MLERDTTPVGSVIVPAWDSGDRIVPTLAALIGQDLPEAYEIIVEEPGERAAGPGCARPFPRCGS